MQGEKGDSIFTVSQRFRQPEADEGGLHPAGADTRPVDHL